jgi:ribosomal protein L37AE/L43A
MAENKKTTKNKENNKQPTELNPILENPIWPDIWSEILILSTEDTIKHLKARKLRTDGQLLQLKSRLFKFVKGEWDPTQFNTELSQQLKNHYTKMTDKIPFCKPIKFYGNIHENIDSFIRKYNKASSINGWTTDQKKSFLTIYLQDTASTFLENFEQNNPNATWEHTEHALRLEFEPTVQKHMLRTMLEKRKQLPDESIPSYINDIENLCRRIDPNMPQSELAHAILRGLKPDIARYVGILDNNNLKELKNNIRKYESIEFILNGKSNQSPDEIRTQITKEHINIIDHNKNQNKKIDELTSQVLRLEKLIKTINSNKNINNWSRNSNNYKYQNNTNKYGKEFAQYNSHINRHNNNYNSVRNNYNDYEQNKRENNYPNRYMKQSNYRKNYTQIQNNQNFGNKHECEHCHKNNHKSSDCKWILICDKCNKRYHTAENCNTKSQNYTNQKNM